MENIQMLLVKCTPIVKAGDKVKKGTKIAEPAGFTGANLHSSVYGTVEEVKEDRIIIKPDEEQPEEYEMIAEDTPLKMGEEAGVIGMGGAGFPTCHKLDIDLRAEGNADGYVLVNASECEPGLRHNIQQIEEDPSKVLKGAEYAKEITNATQIIIAIKKKNQKAVKVLQEAIKDKDDVKLHLLADIYPMGEERAVVRECLGIELEPDKLPSAAHAIVINSETCSRVAEAIDERKPSFLKNITVRGQLVGGNEAHVFMDVPVGTSVGALIERAGGIDGEYGEIVLGGPFTGRATELDAPITKNSGAILVSIPFPDLHGAKMGVLVCACCAGEEREKEVAEKMNAKVISVARCKQAVEVRPGAPLKCERPGNCPGQVKNNLQFKKDGCEYIIIGNCSDCSNTVMASAPQMGLKVFHLTDHLMRTIGHPLYRHLKVSKEVSQEIDF